MTEQQFNFLDMDNWERASNFYFFSKMSNVGYTINIDVDITPLLKEIKQRQIKFYPAYIYLTTRCLNEFKEFKTAYNDGKLGYWETLTPMYPIFHEDTKTVSSIWTECNDDFNIFYQNYMDDIETYGDQHDFLGKPDPPANIYSISTLPWISFKSYTPYNYAQKDQFLPIVESGKYFEDHGNFMLPFSIYVHHASTDGYHVHCFLERFKELCKKTESWLRY